MSLQKRLFLKVPQLSISSKKAKENPGNTDRKGRLSTIDLLIKITGFVK
jgi:hypothetical protein